MALNTGMKAKKGRRWGQVSTLHSLMVVIYPAPSSLDGKFCVAKNCYFYLIIHNHVPRLPVTKRMNELDYFVDCWTILKKFFVGP